MTFRIATVSVAERDLALPDPPPEARRVRAELPSLASETDPAAPRQAPQPWTLSAVLRAPRPGLPRHSADPGRPARHRRGRGGAPDSVYRDARAGPTQAALRGPSSPGFSRISVMYRPDRSGSGPPWQARRRIDRAFFRSLQNGVSESDLRQPCRCQSASGPRRRSASRRSSSSPPAGAPSGCFRARYG